MPWSLQSRVGFSNQNPFVDFHWVCEGEDSALSRSDWVNNTWLVFLCGTGGLQGGPCGDGLVGVSGDLQEPARHPQRHTDVAGW